MTTVTVKMPKVASHRKTETIALVPSTVDVLTTATSNDTTVSKVVDKGRIYETRCTILTGSTASLVGYAQVYTIFDAIVPDAGLDTAKNGLSYKRFSLAHPFGTTEWTVSIVSSITGVEIYADVTKTTTDVVIDLALNPTENYDVTLVGYKL